LKPWIKSQGYNNKQCAIDNAKRTFDVDIPAEIKRIKSEINLAKNGYPAFWLVIRRGFNRNKINPKLSCPMNKVYDTKVKMVQPKTPTLPMSSFFVKYELDVNKRKSKKIEDWIEKYSLDLLNFHLEEKSMDFEGSHMVNTDYLLLQDNFNKLVEDIRKITLPDKYIGLMSWLLNRAFIMTPQLQSNQNTLQTHINKNKALLLKVLYTLNPECLLKCFAKNVIKNEPPNKKIS
jgi:hypothetical protein